MPTSPPKLFVSYCHEPIELKQWVLELSDRLVKDGVNILLDQWDLSEGDNTIAYMESIIGDPEIKKVVLICNRDYKNKADHYVGGVGDEAQIISPQIYKQASQNKFAAIVVERDELGEPFLPVYYGARLYIDFSSTSLIEQHYNRLLRWIFDEPESVKPPVGEKPNLDNIPESLNLNSFISESIDLNPFPKTDVDLTSDNKSVPDSILKAKSFIDRIIYSWMPEVSNQDERPIEDFIEIEDSSKDILSFEGSYLPSHLVQCEEIFDEFISEVTKTTAIENAISINILNSINVAMGSNVVMYISSDGVSVTSDLLDLSSDEISDWFNEKYSKLFDIYAPIQLKVHLSPIRKRSRNSLYVPLDTEDEKKHGFLIYGIGKHDKYTDSIAVLLNSIYQATSKLQTVKSADEITCDIYDALKQKYTYVSNSIYKKRLQIFESSLQSVTVNFEPIVKLIKNIKEIRIWGVEALARIGEATPVSLFKAAELWGIRFQTEFDLYILDKALQSYRDHIDSQKSINPEFEPCPLSINVYPNTILRVNYQKALLAALKHYRINGEKIILEISEKALIEVGDTETGSLNEFNRVQNELISKCSISFAMDDYGTGNSSASRILKLNPEYVKIDREILLYEPFIAKQIIRQLASIKDQRGRDAFKVILEGLDEETHSNIPLAEIITELNVNYIQGHLFNYSSPKIEVSLTDEKMQEIFKLLGW